MAASAQKEKLKIKLTKEENAAYIKLFETYSEEHRSKKDKIIVSAQTVKDLFNKSGLKNTALMRIYELSQQSQKDYLEKIEFVTALKLISIYQNFGSLDNHETLLQAKVSLVKLEGINHNFKESKGIKESNLNIQITKLRSHKSLYCPKKVYSIFIVSYLVIQILYISYNDFEWMHQKLSEDKSYKGLMIPPLPEKKFVGKLDNNFIEKRKEELESYLRVITTHNILKFDQQIFAFLTIEEFEQYRQNPTAFEKVISYANYLPSVKNISISGLQDAVVSVKNTFYEVIFLPTSSPEASGVVTTKFDRSPSTCPFFHVATPDFQIGSSVCCHFTSYQLRTSSLALYQVQTLQSPRIFRAFYQIKISANSEFRTPYPDRIGQVTNRLDNFYSDKLEEDLDFDHDKKQDKFNKEEGSPGLKRNISSSHEYDTLDNIKTDNKIKRYFQQIAQIMEINNPGSQCEIYLREKIQKLQGIIIALEERKTYIKNYATKIEQKYIKNERLSKIEFDSSMKFELNHEIEMLNKDIDDLKISILQQNANLIKETDKLEDTKASQLMKLIIAQGLTLHISFKKIKSFMLENPDFYSVQEQNSDSNNQYLGSQNIIDHTLNQQDSNIVIQDQQQVNEFLNNSRKQSFDQDQRINQNIIGGNNDIYDQYDNLDD